MGSSSSKKTKVKAPDAVTPKQEKDGIPMNIKIVGDTNDYTAVGLAGSYARMVGIEGTSGRDGYFFDQTTKIHGTKYELHVKGLLSLYTAHAGHRRESTHFSLGNDHSLQSKEGGRGRHVLFVPCARGCGRL